MSRIPPNLLYLTIYNPTLRPADPVPEDDEDAEEHAHILFYTSKERAVSRDRMLRQVGLAKALVNFSDMFNASDPCNNVHSQSKRLIMVSPEQDFWIHAGVEVAKIPRASSDKSRGKSASKERSKLKEKGKEKEKEKEKESDLEYSFDYQEGSVHDIALRADILRGYEQFKLIHGSFTSIISTLGRETLEVQLERFFVMWAWTWNLEAGADFIEQLGIPLHPSFRSVGSILDEFSTQLPNHVSSIFIQPPNIVPSSQWLLAQHPTSLHYHLMKLIPPSPLLSNGHSNDATTGSRHPSDDSSNGKDPPRGSAEASKNTFLGISAVNVKWSWPGYLTFGKGAGKRPGLEESNKPAPPTNAEDDYNPAPTPPEAIGLDKYALEDAISEYVSITTPPPDDSQSTLPIPTAENETADPPPAMVSEEATEDAITVLTSDGTVTHGRNPAETNAVSIAPSASVVHTSQGPIHLSHVLPPELSFTNVHLTDPTNPLLTLRQKVYYTINDDRRMIALVGMDEETAANVQGLAESALAVLDDIDTLFTAEMSKTITADQFPTASKILQPTDTHIVSAGGFTVSSPGFSSKSGHLFDAQELQTTDPDLLEVFSRGVNPQHWHIARRGLGASIYGQENDGGVYMQIFRKEASLSDVDNVLAGVVRRSGLVDGSV